MKFSNLLIRSPATNKQFLPLFWASNILFVLTLIFLIVFIFILPNDATNLEYGKTLQLAFYKIKLRGSNNVMSLNWPAYVSATMLLITSLLVIYNYWIFRNSTYSTFIHKHHVYPLFCMMITFLCILFIINIFSKPLLDVKNIDIVKNGWNIKPELDNYSIEFNYVYSIQITNLNGVMQDIKFVNSHYMILWVLLIGIFSIAIITSYCVLFYFGKSFIFPKKGENYV
ncbi:MAG: hypothetical protein ACRC4M_03660 [Mycoplasma sp.]